VRVLVTGGAGFIGSHVADRLAAEGHEPIALDALIPQAHGGEKPPWVGELLHADVGPPGRVAGLRCRAVRSFPQRCVRPRALPTQRQPQRASGAGGAGTGGGGNANRHSVGDHACGDAIGHLAGATIEFVGARPRELDRDLAGAGRADEG
jgi:nucleoside-diphosphate-sugar epimerase